ncbi:MAG: cobalt transporter [Thermoleophilia bacterium]
MKLRWTAAAVVMTIFIAGVLATSSAWDGDITEQAAEPLAREAGVEETQFLPWDIGGDLLLFMFLAGGAAAGFAAGYYWRQLFSESKSGPPAADPGEGTA